MGKDQHYFVLQFNFVVLNTIVKTLDFNFISDSSTFKFTSTFMFTDQHCTRSGAPNENIVQKHLNIALLHVF